MTGNELKIAVSTAGHAIVVSPVGRLDAAGAPILESVLLGAAARGNSVAVLDCAGVDYVSSVGLRVLLIGAKTCMAQGGELTVAALRPNCREVVEASGLLTVLQYRETPEAALAASDRRLQKSTEGSSLLEIEERLEGAVAVLALHGRLDGSSAPQTIAGISTVLKRGIVRVVLDCAGVSYINSTGLRAFLIGAKACRQEGGSLALAALRPQCRSAVEMSGFLSVIGHRETLTAAIAMLGSRVKSVPGCWC